MTVRRSWLNAAFAGLACTTAATAHAYQNPTRFGDTVEEGGGGGRYFTGGPGDGFTCSVCHTKGTPAHLNISGLPEGNYLPGQQYTIMIEWAQELTHVALNAEVTNESGVTLGELTFLKPEEIAAEDQCVGVAFPAALPMPVADGRTVVLAGECGATRARFHWTAPTGSASAAWFSGSLVVSDEDGSVAGDSVTDFSRVIASPTSSAGSAVSIASECAVSTPGGAGHAAAPVLGFGWLLALCGYALRRRQRAQKKLAFAPSVMKRSTSENDVAQNELTNAWASR
jgi:hypothetical protein